MKRCFIFGALPVGDMPILPGADDLVIAADKGYDRAVSLGITPDITVGDFDSRGCAPDAENLVKLQVRKDDTDVGHAVELGFEQGCRVFVIYGAVGGLLDHTFANIVIAQDIASRSGRALFIGGEFSFTVLHDGGLRFPPVDSGRVSVFALSDDAHGVDIKGLSYEVEDISLPRVSHLGVSNAFIGQEARLSVRRGDLLVLFQGQTMPLFED